MTRLRLLLATLLLLGATSGVRAGTLVEWTPAALASVRSVKLAYNGQIRCWGTGRVPTRQECQVDYNGQICCW
jgi:hypothetical protein